MCAKKDNKVILKMSKMVLENYMFFYVVVQSLFISMVVATNTVFRDNDFLCLVICSLPDSFYFRHANETLTLGTLGLHLFSNFLLLKGR